MIRTLLKPMRQVGFRHRYARFLQIHVVCANGIHHRFVKCVEFGHILCGRRLLSLQLIEELYHRVRSLCDEVDGIERSHGGGGGTNSTFVKHISIFSNWQAHYAFARSANTTNTLHQLQIVFLLDSLIADQCLSNITYAKA